MDDKKVIEESLPLFVALLLWKPSIGPIPSMSVEEMIVFRKEVLTTLLAAVLVALPNDENYANLHKLFELAGKPTT